ncbi:MAG TPA: DUF6498-containing protein [Planctomycetia bacterium]|nr:DUF6498-containing protein [Planctomycetia bacterium]
MQILFRLLCVIAANGVVLYGVGFKEWNGATALAVYWIETLVGGFLIAVRIWLHRRWTRKRGHFRAQLGVTMTSEGNGRVKETKFSSFLAEFLVTTIVFSIGHAVFLGFFLFGILKTGPDPELLKWGAIAVGVCQLAGFLVDLPGLRSMSFAALKRMAGLGMARVVLLQFAIIGGMGIAAWSGRNEAFLIPFAILKLLADVAGAFSGLPQKKTAPAWLVRLMNRVRPGEDFAAYLASEAAREGAEERADEEVMPEKPAARTSRKEDVS